MNLSVENLSQFEIAAIVLLFTILIVIVVSVLHLNKNNNESALRSEEHARVAQALQESFQRTRSELIESQNNTQSRMERRFGEVQQAVEKRLHDLLADGVQMLGKPTQAQRFARMHRDSPNCGPALARNARRGQAVPDYVLKPAPVAWRPSGRLSHP